MIREGQGVVTEYRALGSPGASRSIENQRRRFDVIYERTFLCSLPPRLWKNYVHRVAQLLQPKGKLAGFFLYGEEIDPPPYPLTETCAKKLFPGRFELLRNEAVADSLPIFRGMEKWQEWALL